MKPNIQNAELETLNHQMNCKNKYEQSTYND